jgi:hypothetical protein
MTPELLPNVVRFPTKCPKCGAVSAMPFRAGTLAEGRTQVDLTCGACRHDWSIEMTPPVLIVKPERQADAAATDSASSIEEGHERRSASHKTRRMRVGLCGLLMPADETDPVTVLYSLDADRMAGRLRLLHPNHVFPPWLSTESRLKLSGYDGVAFEICITAVKLPPEGSKDDDHFAEFVVRPIAH